MVTKIVFFLLILLFSKDAYILIVSDSKDFYNVKKKINLHFKFFNSRSDYHSLFDLLQIHYKILNWNSI